MKHWRSDDADDNDDDDGSAGEDWESNQLGGFWAQNLIYLNVLNYSCKYFWDAVVWFVFDCSKNI